MFLQFRNIVFAIFLLGGGSGSVTGELALDLTVDVSVDTEGVFTYAYTLFNDHLNTQSINSILLSTGANASIIDITGPNDNWISSYESAVDIFQAGFATGLSTDGQNCGVTDEFDLFPGQTASFTLTSPWAPGSQPYAIGRTVGVGVACDFVGDFATGQIDGPSFQLEECDFDRNRSCDLDDIDLLTTAIANQSQAARFDLNLDTVLDTSDLTTFLRQVGRRNGDSDFDGNVAFADFLTLSAGFGGFGVWSDGDFSANGTIDFADFLVLSSNFGQPLVSPTTVSTIPEPDDQASLALLVFLLAIRTNHSALRQVRATTRWNI